MSGFSQTKYLEDQLRLLVNQFGGDKVQRAFAKIRPDDNNVRKESPRNNGVKHPSRSDLRSLMKTLRVSDAVRHQLLSDFLKKLEARIILPESQDLYLFAQIVGLKELPGKARRDMIPTLLAFLTTVPNEKLDQAFEQAKDISAEQRSKGFSVLTDKLLSK